MGQEIHSLPRYEMDLTNSSNRSYCNELVLVVSSLFSSYHHLLCRHCRFIIKVQSPNIKLEDYSSYTVFVIYFTLKVCILSSFYNSSALFIGLARGLSCSLSCGTWASRDSISCLDVISGREKVKVA